MNVIYTLLGLSMMGGFYMLPTIIAGGRHHNPSGVAIVNVLTGWTVIGWFVALVMACGARGRS